MDSSLESSRRFYENKVRPMLKEYFSEYEEVIAVGLAGEGSDCFGYDDFISRDHDFGTGVCLWLRDEDYEKFGTALSEKYEMLVDAVPDNNLSVRLRQRRGVMTIHDFYSSILWIDADTDNTVITDSDWTNMDHNCVATAVNGEVFRDDLGLFTAYRNKLLLYYPDNIWRQRIAEALHKFALSMQVNYARCMARDDTVAARLCHMEGLEAAMELFFLLKKIYKPYYKWTYRRLCELDKEGRFSRLIKTLADEPGDKSVWEGKGYHPNYLNLSDPLVLATERIAKELVMMMNEIGLTEGKDPYLERYVDEVLG